MKKLLAFLLLLCALSAHATTYYIVDCQTGADAACAANVGANANAGTVSTLPKQTYTQLSFGAGDQVLLAKGGSWTVATYSPSCSSCTVANPLTFGTFVPAWGAGTAAPKINPSLVSSIPFFLNSPGGAGYVFNGLHLIGLGSTQTSIGFYAFSGASGVTLTGVEIEGFLHGVVSNDNGSVDFTLKSSSIHDNKDLGILAGGNGLLIENNTFDNNGYFTGSTGSHNIYISGGNPVVIPGRRTVVRGNTLTRAVQTSGQCNAVELVVHGAYYGLVIENNTIDDSADASGAAATCWGIFVGAGDLIANERYEGAVIRGNKVINVGNLGIAVSNCLYCLIENNIVTYTTAAAFSVTGIKAWNFQGTGVGTSYINDKLVIRNNSIYLPPNNFAGNIGIGVTMDGTGHRVFNNVVYFPTTSSASANCYDTFALSNFTTWDYNLCYRVGGANTYSTLYATLALAQGAGADVHGSVSDPTLTATPAIGNAYDIAFTNGLTKNGGTTPCPITTYGGFKRTGTCDIGAHQQGASVLVPNSPTGVH